MACEKLPYERTWFVRSAVSLSMVKSKLSVPKKNLSVWIEAPLKQPAVARTRLLCRVAKSSAVPASLVS